MRRSILSAIALLTIHVAACGGGGDGGGGGPGAGGSDGAGGTTAEDGGSGTDTGSGTGTTDSIPEIFYGPWAYMHATLYEPGEEPFTTSVSGTATFERDGTYEQSYTIGDIFNGYQGTYAIDAQRLRTFDEQGEEVFDFRWVIGDDPTVGVPVLTLFLDDEQGNPSIMYALAATERD